MDSWLTAQHSNILRIEVNELHKEFIQQPHFQIPLMTDMVMLALDNAINDEEKLNYLQNRTQSGRVTPLYILQICQIRIVSS
jgi:hypothetical protein